MKVLHICTYSRGGAFRSAQRLHEGLLKLGVDSKVLFLEGAIINSTYSKFYYVPKSLKERLWVKLNLEHSVEKKRKQAIKKIPGNYERLSWPLTPYRIEDHKLVEWADIIDLHWVSDFLDYQRFFKVISKPLVWTLHDMNPFMGLVHYQEDYDSNYLVQDLDKSLRTLKTECVSKSNITIASPSKWLMKASQSSKMFKEFKHVHIPYGIDTTVFKPHNKSFSRNVLSVPEDKIVFLFVVDFLVSKRKGGQVLQKALEEIIDEESNILIMTVGNGEIKHEKLKNNLINLGSISDDRLMSIIYSAADALLLPSKEDNLPNVMIESLVCGTPVITNKVGGMKDVIVSSENGVFTEGFSAKDLKKAIKYFLSKKSQFSSRHISSEAAQRFALKRQAQTYIDLYQDIID